MLPLGSSVFGVETKILVRNCLGEDELHFVSLGPLKVAAYAQLLQISVLQIKRVSRDASTQRPYLPGTSAAKEIFLCSVQIVGIWGQILYQIMMNLD